MQTPLVVVVTLLVVLVLPVVVVTAVVVLVNAYVIGAAACVALEVAASVGGVAEKPVAGACGNEMVLVLPVIWIVCVTGAAAVKLALPLSDAVIVHAPTASGVTCTEITGGDFVVSLFVTSEQA